MDISVRLLDNSQYRLRLHQEASPLTLKSYIQVRAGLPIPLQVLFAHGKVLSDDEQIRTYAEEEIAVRLNPASKFPLQFTVVLASGLSLPIEVLLGDTVGKMKEEIAEVLRIPCAAQRLVNSGMHLLDSQTVSEVYRPGNFLCYLLQPSDFFLQVTTAIGQCFQVPVRDSDRLSRVTDFLRNYCAFDCRGQTITCSGEKVGSLASLRILKSRQISCVATGFWVWMETIDVPSVQVQLHPFAPLIGAVSRSCSRLPQGSTPWVLSSGRVISLSATANSEKLAPGAILEYGDLLLHVRSFNIEKIDLAVPSDSYVFALKRELAKRLRKGEFKLMYCGYELSSMRTLADCGMQRTSTVEIVEVDSVYVWYDFGVDRELRDFRTMQTKHHRRPSTKRVVFSGTIHNSVEDVEFSSGGVMHVPVAGASIVIACRYGEKVYRAVMKVCDTVATLATALRAVFPLYRIERVSDELEVVNIPRHRVRMTIDSRRFIGCRFRDGRVHWVLRTPGEKVADLKEKLVGRRYPAAIVFRDCCLSDTEVISDYAEGEFVDVCQDREIVLCGESPKDRYILPLPQSCATLSDLYSLCKPLFPGPLLLFSSSLLPNDATDLLEFGVRTGSCIHAISTASCIAVQTMSPNADKFIYLQRLDGSKCVLLFHHSTTRAELILYISLRFHIGQFSLVLDGKMMTNYRFQRVRSGATVEVIVSTEAVTFCHGDNAVSFAPLAPTATVQQAKATAHAPGTCYWRDKVIDEKTVKLKALIDAEVTVVYCVPEKHAQMRLERVDMEATYISLPRSRFTMAELIDRIRISECDPYLRPSFFSLPSKAKCNYDLFQCMDLYTLREKSLLMLLPPQVFITVSTRKHGNFELFMTTNDVIWTVRKAAAEKMRVSLNFLRLYYKDCLLADDSISLEAHGISQHCSLTALQLGDVFVRISWKNRKFASVEGLSHSISALTRSVCSSMKVSRSGSRLLLEEKTMDNGKTIQDYTDSGEVDLQLLRGSEALVRVTTAEGREYAKVARRVEVSYSYLRRMGGFHLSDTLLCVGELKDSYTISDYRLNSDSAIFLLCSPRASTTGMYLYVRFSDGRKVKVYILNQATVAEAVQTVRSRTVSEVTALLINEEIAEEKELIMDYGVANGTEIYALLESERIVKVLYKSSPLLLAAKDEVSMHTIKTMVETRLSIPARMQMLYFRNNLLCDSMKVAELETISTLELRTNPNFVCVRTVNFQTAVPRPDSKETVREWKTQLERLVKIPSNQQRILGNEEELKDDEAVGGSVEQVVILRRPISAYVFTRHSQHSPSTSPFRTQLPTSRNA